MLFIGDCFRDGFAVDGLVTLEDEGAQLESSCKGGVKNFKVAFIYSSFTSACYTKGESSAASY